MSQPISLAERRFLAGRRDTILALVARYKVSDETASRWCDTFETRMARVGYNPFDPDYWSTGQRWIAMEVTGGRLRAS